MCIILTVRKVKSGPKCIYVFVGFTPKSRSPNVTKLYWSTQLKKVVSNPHYDQCQFVLLYSYVSNDAVIKSNISYRDKRNFCFDAVKLGIVKTIGNEKKQHINTDLLQKLN